MRAGTAGIVYRDRLLRDRQLVRKTRGRMTYAFFVHDAHLGRSCTLRSLQEDLARTLKSVICISLGTMEEECAKLSIKTLNYRPGTGKAMLGWRFPWSRIQQQLIGQTYYVPGLKAFDLDVPNVHFAGKP